MVDDKKIEEAARRNADKYRNYPTLSDEDRDKVSIGSFMDCAKWMQEEFLKDLWHPIEEKPQKEKTFLYQTSYNGFGLNQISDIKDWNFIIKYQKATRWLYVEDLLPKTQKENKL